MKKIFWLYMLLFALLGCAPAMAVQPQAEGDPAAPRAYPVVVVATGATQLTSPDAVEEGGVLLVRVHNTADAERAMVTWRDQEHDLVLLNGHGEVVLAAPLERGKTRTCTLTVRVNNEKVQTTVNILPVRWPVQTLQVDPKYVSPPAAAMKRIQSDQARTKAALAELASSRSWETPFIRPVSGSISSTFGGKRVFNGEPRSRHRGVDLRGATGTPIVSMARGKVVLAEEQYFSGNVVYVDHGQGLVTIYCHMSAMHVQVGDMVEAGQTLGLVGATGRVTGPHLHLGARVFGETINPMTLLTLS